MGESTTSLSPAGAQGSSSGEPPIAHLNNALQLLQRVRDEFFAHGDDPSVLVSLEEVGFEVASAYDRVQKALEQLAPPPTVPCPMCNTMGRVSIMTEVAPGALRCVWCGHDEAAVQPTSAPNLAARYMRENPPPSPNLANPFHSGADVDPRHALRTLHARMHHSVDVANDCADQTCPYHAVLSASFTVTEIGAAVLTGGDPVDVEGSEP